MINFTLKKTGWNSIFSVDATYSRNFRIAQINLEERNRQEERFRKSLQPYRVSAIPNYSSSRQDKRQETY
jgi:hypothetical protein